MGRAATEPSKLNSIAHGRLVSTLRTGSSTTRVFREDRKLATELMQIGVGPFTVLHRKGPHGMDLRYAVPTAQLAAIEPQLKSFDQSVRFLEQRLGRFPVWSYMRSHTSGSATRSRLSAGPISG
ncbi:M1 family metallopeptidase [Kribbella qitaiheensis]|uniref:M1 family metallopeptidase n=1 Tax=Kribbella qitaiheensis TaxID=1544730 RepID=A0A7G6X3Y7_9ACTN|nr:hypothetical protein [Kribbella qitaiheensis]QNE20952.1 M1 family metallopeptidase [Kribbella qitaiheensis]